MALRTAYPHVEAPPGEPARLRRLTRIRVAQIVADYLAYGWSAEEMCRQHPHLKPAEVHAALTYYFDHQDVMDQEIQAEWAKANADRAGASLTPFARRMRFRAS